MFCCVVFYHDPFLLMAICGLNSGCVNMGLIYCLMNIRLLFYILVCSFGILLKIFLKSMIRWNSVILLLMIHSLVFFLVCICLCSAIWFCCSCFCSLICCCMVNCLCFRSWIMICLLILICLFGLICLWSNCCLWSFLANLLLSHLPLFRVKVFLVGTVLIEVVPTFLMGVLLADTYSVTDLCLVRR